MSTYCATVRWSSTDNAVFSGGRYSRAHEWEFDGGAVVAASASPGNVPQGTANEAGIDPEEAFIAAISSCHMLFFLDYARRAGFVVSNYVDEAIGLMEKGENGKIAVTKVTLRPKITFDGEKRPDADEISRLHQRSHHDCFIANSIKSEVIIEQ